MGALHILFHEDLRSLTGLVALRSLSFFESLRLLTEISLCTRILFLLLDLLAPTSFQCCFPAIYLNGICCSFHSLVLQCFLPLGRRLISHYTQLKQQLYTNARNIH